MQYLADTEKEKIGELVKEILIKLNITQAEIAEALGISAGTIKNILKGRAVPLPLTKEYKLPIEPELRRKVKEYHKKYKIVDEHKLLDKQPKLLIAITDRLIPEGFLKKPKMSGEIADILKEEYGIETNSSVLSKELQKAIELGFISVIDENVKRFQYQQTK